MLLTIEETKKHLNIDEAFTEDDAYLTSLCEVAEALVQKHIDRKFEDIIALEGELPRPLLHAVLLFIGNFYANRESVAYSNATSVPMSVKYILDMYRDYTDHPF